MVKVMAPFTPFLTEHMYQNLKHFIDDKTLSEVEKNSVHFLMLPEPRYLIVRCYRTILVQLKITWRANLKKKIGASC